MKTRRVTSSISAVQDREMEKLESDLESLMKERMKSDKAYMKRLRDLEKRRRLLMGKIKVIPNDLGKRRRLLKGKIKAIPNSGGGGGGCGGRELNLNDSGEEEIISTADSVGAKTKKGKSPQLEEGVFRVTRRCDLDRIDQIKKNLEKENLELFGKSCFGHLLKINSNDLKFQGQVFAQLLMHLDMDAANKERQLVFNLRNSQITFSAKDFALVTGLRLGTSSEEEAAAATTTSQLSFIHENVLGGRQTTTLKEFEEAFLRVSREHEGRGELTLKLALLYFVFGILLPKQPLDKIEARYLHLVEDVEKFNAFCWGRVSYEFLVSSVLSARSSMDSLESVSCRKKGRRKDANLNIHGFIFALQIWGYEVMPSLAEYCAENILNSLTLHPRILRWTTPKRSILFENLKKFFAPGDDGGNLVVDDIKEEVEELCSQPKRAKVVISNKDQKCSTSSGANEDVIITISDDVDDDEEENENKPSDVASDDDSCSTTFMDNFVAGLHK